MSKIKEKLLKKKGSILVYSLIIMFVILSISLGITKITLTKQKTASNINRSTQAFQVANSGVEKVLQKIKGRSGSINKISGINCNVNQSTFNEAGGTVTVTYLDSSGKTLNCTDNISKIAKIKSVGEINKTKRAIEVALAANSGSPKWVFLTKHCIIKYDSGKKGKTCTVKLTCPSGLVIGAYEAESILVGEGGEAPPITINRLENHYSTLKGEDESSYIGKTSISITSPTGRDSYSETNAIATVGIICS